MKIKIISSLAFIVFCTVTVNSSQADLKIYKDNRIESTHGQYSVLYPIIEPDRGGGGSHWPPFPPRLQPPDRGYDDPPPAPGPPNDPWNPRDPNDPPPPKKTLRELIEDEFGTLTPEMDLEVKKEILKKYPTVNHLENEDILEIICSNEPELQRQVMRKLDNYSSLIVELYKTFEVYDEEVQRLYHLRGYPIYRFSTYSGKEYADPTLSWLYKHAHQSMTRQRALRENGEIEDYCQDLANVSKIILTFTKPDELQTAIHDLKYAINEVRSQGPALAQELLHRDAYESESYPYYYLTKRKKPIKEKQYARIIDSFGLEPSDLRGLFSTDPPPYLDCHGTLFHREQKVAILDALEALDIDRHSKQWPTLSRIYPHIRQVYKHSLLENHLGSVVNPHRLWLMGQMMSLMAKSNDKYIPLMMPFAFVDEHALPSKVQGALLQSQDLFSFETFRSLLKRLPGYRRNLDQLQKHFSDCPNCKFPCYKKCNEGKVNVPAGHEKQSLYIAVQNEYNRLKQEEAQLNYLRDIIEQRREADRKDREEKLELMQQAELGIVNHQDYIKSKLTQWRTERSQELDALQNNWQQQLLTDNAYALLNAHHCSARPFQKIYVEDDQLVFCNEYITLVNNTADTNWDTSDMMQAHIQRTIIKFAEIGAWSLQTDNREYTEALANLCRAFFEFGTAHLATVQNPHPDIITVPGFIVGPVAIVANDYGESVCNAAYHFANVLNTVCNITVTNQVDPNKLPHEIAYAQVQNIKNTLERREPDYRYDFDPDNGLSEFAIRSLTYKESYQYAQVALTIATIGLALVAPYIGGPGLAISASGTVALSAEYATSLCIAVAASAAHMLKPWIAHYHESNDKGLGSRKQAGRYRSVEELREDAKPLEDLTQRKEPGDVKQGQLRGDAKKIFAELAESYGEEIKVDGKRLFFGGGANTVSLYPSTTSTRPTIHFTIGEIIYKIRISP